MISAFAFGLAVAFLVLAVLHIVLLVWDPSWADPTYCRVGSVVYAMAAIGCALVGAFT